MAKKREPELTEEQRQKIELRKKLLFNVCESKEELQQFIKTFLKLDLPDCTVDEMSTSNPMESVWQIYLTMKTNKGAHRVVVAASRNSMKTVMSAVIHWLAMVHFRRSCLQIAAIKDQSYKAIKYLKKFLRIPELQDHFETNRAGELRLFNLPPNSYTAKDDADVFVTAATLEGANSSRASIIIRDECDLTPREILSEVAMVADPTQDEHGFEPITISLSSRKTSQGPLQELMEEAEKGTDSDIRLDKWSAVDFMRKCLPETHGEKRLKAYLHTENLKVRWDEEVFQEEPDAIKVKYKEILAYEGCMTCPAFIACQARAPKQTGKSKTLRTIAFTGNFIKETKEANKIVAQILNWRPETGGLVFPTFNRALHVRNTEETWFWTTGQQWKGNRRCTKQDIYAWAVTNKWEVSFGIDWGVRDSAVISVVLYSQSQVRSVVLHVRAATGYPNSQWAQTVREKECLTFPPDIVCPDTADAGSTHYFQPFGFAVKPKKPTHIETGVVQVQSLLWNVERQENDMIFCKADNDSGMEYAIESMIGWMHKRDPRGEFDTSRFEDDDNTHFIDSLRYALDKYRTAVEVRIASKKIEAAPLNREEAYRKEMELAMYETYKDMGVPMMPSQLAEKTIESYQRAGMGHLVDGGDTGPAPEPKKKLIKFSF